MGWSGGTYRKGNYGTNGWTGDASLGIGIEAGRHDTQDDDFANGINQCLNKDGSNAATGNLNIGSNRVTNVATGTARTDAATVAQVQDRTSSYLGTTGGTSTAFTVTATPTITALTTGAQYVFKANAANGAAATLKIDGTAATTMQRQGTALAGNEFKADDFITVVYDGTNFQITNIATAPLFVNRTNNRVGVGTTAPGADVDVQGTGTQLLETRFSADTSGSQLYLRKSRGAAVGTNTIVTSGDQLGGIYFSGANGTGYDAAAAINGYSGGTPGASGDMPGELRFFTCADGSASLTERMRIIANGNVGIGATPDATFRLHVVGSDSTSSNAAFVVRNSATTGLFSVRNDGAMNFGGAAASPYNDTTASAANLFVQSDGYVKRSTSSLRYKTDVIDYNKGLSDVLALRPVYYKGINDGSTQFAGLIAEEVDAQGLSEFVVYNNENEPDALHYGNMVALAFKAIQELNAKVELLEARIAALEA